MHKLYKIISVVRDFLFSSLNREFLIFLFFLALSGAFWLLMTLNETYEKDYPVGLRITGVPQNVVITSDMSDTVYVTVKDKGFVLLSYETSNQLRPLSVNFNSYANHLSGRGQVTVAELQKLLMQQLSGSSVITAVKADCLDFYFNYGLKKQVKVEFVGNIIPAKNYYLAHVQYSPEVVSVYASSDKLDSIKNVVTEQLDVYNFADTVVRTVKLKPIVGAKIVPQTVMVTLYPDMLTEKSVEVPIMAINKPDHLIIRTFPQRVKIHFTVGMTMYRSVNPSDFKVVVDYKDVMANPSDKCRLYLQGKPRGVNNVRMEMSQVDYLIEQ